MKKRNVSDMNKIAIVCLLGYFTMISIVIVSVIQSFNSEPSQEKNKYSYNNYTFTDYSSFLGYGKNDDVSGKEGNRTYTEITKLNNEEYLKDNNNIENIQTEETRMNNAIENRSLVSYKATRNKDSLDIFIENDSSYAISSLNIYAIFKDNDGVNSYVKEQTLSYISPNGKKIVHFSPVPEDLAYEIIVSVGDIYNANDMSQNISGKIVQFAGEESYNLLITKEVIENINWGSAQVILYDEEDSIVDIYDFTLFMIKNDSTYELYNLPNFERYELVLNAYNVIK